MAIGSGTRIGPYEVVAPLGSGGMGEVYRARDPRLRRDVAIKVIAARFATDPERLKRFQQEALAAAALTHPSIIAVYDVGTFDGSPYLVTECLAGESLRQRLAAGPVPLRRAVHFGLQIVQGIAAAHEKGIIHRDLKPENIFITLDERVKILDFGLAKLVELEARAESQLATAPEATEAGVVMGTAGYMAPEQARGEGADQRCDIFAVGAILYEMLSGRRAFKRDTTAETLTAILREEVPDLLDASRAVSPALARVVAHCLEKRPGDRFQTARDLAFSLETIGSLPAVAETSNARTLVWRSSIWPRVAAMTAAIVAVGGAIVARRLIVSAPPQVAEVRVHRLTDARGLEEFPAISPDGKSVAFVAHMAGNVQIFVRLVAGGTPIQITRDAADHLYPRWSPDSAAIIYYRPPADGESAGAIWEIPALGGGARRLASSVGGVDISHDGKQLVFPRVANGRLELAVSARDASNATTLVELESGYYYMTPRWSFDGRYVAYQRGTASTFDIFVVSTSDRQSRQVTHSGGRLEGLTWAPERHRIIFSSSQGATIWYLPTTNLWRIEADGSGLTQLTFGEVSYGYPDTNAGGTLVVQRVRRQFDIWRYPTDKSPAENVRAGVLITHQTSAVHTPSAAPGGREIVYVSDSGAHANIWVTNLETRESRQITHEVDPAVRVGLPLWSPDATQIAYFTAVGSAGDYHSIRPDGSDARLLARAAGWATWSPDGLWLYFSDYPTGTHLRKVRATGGEPVVVRSDSAFRVAIAPDDGTLYYATERVGVSGASDLDIRAARPEDAPSRLLARIAGRRMAPWQVSQPVISPDGKWLALALLDGVTSNLWALSTSTGQLRQLTDFGEQPTFIVRRVSWSSDGRFIFAAVGEGDSDVVLLEGLKT